MKLKDVELIPGVVVENEDPMYMGRVKVSAPGEFDVDTMKIKDMFWVYPLSMWGYQSFSRMMKGSKVWLIHNTANYYEYWYIPYFELNANTATHIYGDDATYTCDMVISRSNGSADIQFYYNTAEGFVQKLGMASIEMMSDGSIFLTPGGGSAGDGIFHTNAKMNEIGADNGDDLQFACRGENMVSMMNDLQSNFQELLKSASTSPYTTHLVASLQKISDTLGKYKAGDENDVRAEHVKIN
jgi:hypothetical protein